MNAIVGIVRSDVHRTRRNAGEGAKTFVYVAAGTFTGLTVGAVLGAAGGLIPIDARAAIAVVVSLFALVIGLVELAGRRVSIPQRDRETPYGWLGPGPFSWAIRNGAAIGFGWQTRLGYWLWYVIPVGSLLSGDPLIAAIGYATYSFVRTASPAVLVRLERAEWFTDIEILRSSPVARRITDAQLVLIGLAGVLLIGI